MTGSADIFIVDDDIEFRKTLCDILTTKGYTPVAVETGKTALKLISAGEPEVALIDLKLGDMSGLDLIRKIKKQSPVTECIVITGHASQKSAIDAVNLGAYGYMTKPYDIDQMILMVRRAIDKHESDEKFRALCATSQDSIIMVDNNDIIIYWNKASENIFGYSNEEAIGKHLRKLIIPEELRERHLNGFNKFRETGEGKVIGKRVELPAITKDEKDISIELSLGAVNIRGQWDAIGIIREITKRKKAEEELRRTIEERDRNINEMRQLMDFETTMREEIHEDTLLKHVARILKENFNADIAAILMLDMEKSVLYVPIINPAMPVDKLIKNEAFLDPSLCSVIRTGHEHVVRDITEDVSCECISYNLENGGYVCLPLIASGMTIGAILLINKDRGYGDSQEELETMKSHAGLVAVALQRVRLMDTTKHAAVTDTLTGIYNRRFFDEILEKQIALSKRLSKSLSILIADLDHFKKLNDTYGHVAGDSILKGVTAIMRKSTRSSDILARYGGEEFVVVMPETDITGAIERANRMRQGIEDVNFDNIVKGQSLKVTLSIGVASLPEHGAEFDELVRTADSALYKAKEGGRNRVEVP